MRKIFISPHNDDEVLFGFYTICREAPEVAVVYDSYIQPSRGHWWCDHQTRRKETEDAMTLVRTNIAWAHKVHPQFLELRDDEVDRDKVLRALSALISAPEVPTRALSHDAIQIWGPGYEEGGNRHHNLIASVLTTLVPNYVRYATYTSAGKTVGTPVAPISWAHIELKLRAMAIYRSQIRLEDCRPHFTRSLEEYYLP